MKLKTSKVIYVDVDGTICQNRDDLRDQDISIAYSDVKPYPDRIAHINSLYDDGHEIVYWTARGGTTGKSWRTFTKQQIDNWGCQYTRIEIRRKPSYDLFIDDKSKRIEEI